MNQIIHDPNWDYAQLLEELESLKNEVENTINFVQTQETFSIGAEPQLHKYFEQFDKKVNLVLRAYQAALDCKTKEDKEIYQ